MQFWRLGFAAVSAWSVVSSAWAACMPEGPAARAFTTRGYTEQAARLLVMSGTLMTMEAYRAKNLRRIKAVCEVATLKGGKIAYTVSGTSNAALPRIMTPNDRKAPLLFLMSVPDIAGPTLKPGAAADPLGYVLASQDDKSTLVLRAYDVIPPDQQLALDVGAALEGRIPAMMRVDLANHQIDISAAEDAGEVAERLAGPPSQPLTRQDPGGSRSGPAPGPAWVGSGRRRVRGMCGRATLMRWLSHRPDRSSRLSD
jgi:hypothetical protein